ncbi:unnamed protein product [Lepidochelys kempii]
MLQQVHRKQKGSCSLQTAGCGRISFVSLEESQMPEKTTACLDNREGTVGQSSDYALFTYLARQKIGPDFLEHRNGNSDLVDGLPGHGRKLDVHADIVRSTHQLPSLLLKCS